MKINRLYVLVLVLALAIAACVGPSSETSQTSSDLSVVAGPNAKQFLGDNYESEGLLQQFYKETGNKVYVEYLDGTDAEAIKSASLGVTLDKKTAETFDAFIFDDQLFGAGLKDISFPARAFVGVWISQDKANDLGLTVVDPYLTHEQFARMLESGGLKIVTAPANKGTAAALEFFATMAYCSGNPSSQLTTQTVQDSKDCGKRIYDYFARSAGSTDDAVKMVFDDSINGSNLFDGVIAYQSSFAGEQGLNQQLVNKGKVPFLFFYFKDASPMATMIMGNTGNLSEAEKKVYDEFAAYLLTDTSQQAVASHALLPGSSAFGVSPDYSAFRADWGLTVNPQSTPINPPVYSVAKQALDIYRDYYKRVKVVKACVDVSPSMFQESMKINVNGKSWDVLRIQALNRALLKITDSQWLVDNNIVPGQNDVFDYYFFSSGTTGLVTETIGVNTNVAGDRINSILGPWNDADPRIWNSDQVWKNLAREFNGFQPNGTEMFECANLMLQLIEQGFNPEIDYYIVILTDGENMSGMNADQFFAAWNSFSGKTSVTVIGIAFGTKGKSINAVYTQQFGGNTYMGDNDEGLLNAFKAIYGR
ncbi:MAG: hypothetical protein UW31_C0002G0051 [Candidatus Collierbacteria bacterium GW2011_GWA2_44_13]|nr:MAG: hypothetical protein UW31_C0002G0051 [Candidatus Collierbacteria bacterium GW2011_GWA2_44_13]